MKGDKGIGARLSTPFDYAQGEVHEWHCRQAGAGGSHGRVDQSIRQAQESGGRKTRQNSGRCYDSVL
jgi:hypothetical protein